MVLHPWGVDDDQSWSAGEGRIVGTVGADVSHITADVC